MEAISGSIGSVSGPDTSVAAPPKAHVRVAYFALAVAFGIVVAGFWNYQLVDGFGRDVVAANTIGEYSGRAGEYPTRGGGFGFVFAIVAGLAATFTACNCVVFAMIPGLACASDKAATRRSALQLLGVMTFFVVAVGAVYGVFIGWLGPEGVEAINARAVRFAQAGVVFSTLGVAMLAWAAVELGLLDRFVSRLSPVTRAFFAQPTTKAAILGIMVGAFAVGRPYPVFRELLLYTAQAGRPSYGAAVMALQGLGQILVMVVLFVALFGLFGDKIGRWIGRKPYRTHAMAGIALAAGGAYFLFYWGISRIWPELGRWGFKLGIYG